MSLVPDEQSEIVVSKSDVKPLDPKDPPGKWMRFVNFLRQNIGLKTLDLSERWAEAKVYEIEVQNDLASLQGKLDYERTMAEIQQQKLVAKSDHAQGMANANLTNQQARETAADAHIKELAAKHLEAAGQSREEALQRLSDTMQQIANSGGVIEHDFSELLESHDLNDDGTGDEDA